MDPYQLDILTRTILGEAAGEDPVGQAAVGAVIMNRVADPRWPGDLAAVALQPKQFSAWNSGVGGNHLTDLPSADPRYQSAQAVAKQVLSGDFTNPVGGATHYYSPAGMAAHVQRGEQSNLLPTWLEEEAARGAPVEIGGHIFVGNTSAAPAAQEASMNTNLFSAPSPEEVAGVVGFSSPQPSLPQPQSVQSAAFGAAPQVDTRSGARRYYDAIGDDYFMPTLLTGLSLLAGGDQALPMLGSYIEGYTSMEEQAAQQQRVAEAMQHLDNLPPNVQQVVDAALAMGDTETAFQVASQAALQGSDPLAQARLDLERDKLSFGREKLAADRAGLNAKAAGDPFTLSAGEARYAPDGSVIARGPEKPSGSAKKLQERRDLLQAAGIEEKSEQGRYYLLTGKLPDGRSIEVGADGSVRVVEGAGEFGSSVRSDIEKQIVQGADRLAQIKEINKNLKPEFQSFNSKLKNVTAALADKAGIATPEQKAILEEHAEQSAKIATLQNRVINQLSGAAVSDGEAARLNRELVDLGEGVFDGDSPAQMKRKLENFQKLTAAAIARAEYWRRNGANGNPWDAAELGEFFRGHREQKAGPEQSTDGIRKFQRQGIKTGSSQPNSPSPGPTRQRSEQVHAPKAQETMRALETRLSKMPPAVRLRAEQQLESLTRSYVSQGMGPEEAMYNAAQEIRGEIIRGGFE